MAWMVSKYTEGLSEETEWGFFKFLCREGGGDGVAGHPLAAEHVRRADRIEEHGAGELPDLLRRHLHCPAVDRE